MRMTWKTMTALVAAPIAGSSEPPRPLALPPNATDLTEYPTTTSAPTEALVVQTSPATIPPTAAPQDIYARFGRSARLAGTSFSPDQPTAISFEMSQ